ncbi:hypothetical protein F4820DRAFT_462088 [Hypoxylon rubiginosum]|uniref:Uncharacterized protein n=1 Tax=Hypoxylon rubiginosum TaxID=110542 RepID=A0ACB9YMA3_9PEZI|nr:hypothetical protein F4820DRAFT_462088 [Hypoxylon rubiginosum]
MATKERLMRLSLAHYRKDGCSEGDCHFFGTVSHAKQAATLHASHGVVFYHQVYSTTNTRSALDAFKRELSANWEIDDHNLTVELYIRDLETLRAIASDPVFATFSNLEEPYLSRRHVVASLAWVEVYIEEGKVVGLAQDGTPTYKPSFDDFVKPGGVLEQALK